MPPQIVSFRTTIPQVNPKDEPTFYWDTSFIICALVAPLNDARSRQCSKFGRYLASPKTGCLNVTSDFAVNEVLYKRLCNCVERAWRAAGGPGTGYKDWRRWLKGNQGIIPQFQEQLRMDLERIRAVVDEIICSGSGFDLSGEALDIIVQHEMLPTDAYQVAVTKDWGIDRIISLDCDFCNLGPDYTIYCY